MAGTTRAHRGIRFSLTFLSLVVVLLSALSAPGPAARAQAPDAQSGLPTAGSPCPVAQIRSGTGTRESSTSQLAWFGPLFAEGGHFAEHGVDEQCDDDVVLGPFIVLSGGVLRAEVVGNPPVPNKWSGANYNTGLTITFEPMMGDSFGPPKTVVALGLQGENNEQSGEGQWDGPGRLWAYVLGPWGRAPLSYSCYEQDYQVSAEIIEWFPTSSALPGMDILADEVIKTDGAGLSLTMDGNATSVWLEPRTEAQLLNSPLDTLPGTVRSALWHRPQGILVQDEGQTAGDSTNLGMPEWLLELKQMADNMAGEGYVMPRGYREDDIEFWFNRSLSTSQEAYNRIKDQKNPAEAAVEFRLYMDSKEGQWTMLNAGERGSALLSDVVMTWLLPNEWNGLESFIRYVLRPVPVLGQIANLKNTKDTADRILKELVWDAAGKKAARSLATFEATRGWTVEEVQARNQELAAEVELHKAIIADARAKMEATLTTLVDNYNGLGCGAFPSMGEAQADLCRRAQYELDHSGLRAEDEFNAVLREELAFILEAETEISDLTNYRLPIASGDNSTLKTGRPVPDDSSGLCLPKPMQMILRGGAANFFRDKPLAPLLIWAADTYLLPRGTEFRVERIGEDGVLVQVFDGEVEVFAADGSRFTVYAGQEARLPEGVISPVQPDAYQAVTVDGIPLQNLPTDAWVPEPYGVQVALFHPPLDLMGDALRRSLGILDSAFYGRAVWQGYLAQAEQRFGAVLGDRLPPGWYWQDTDINYAVFAPGETPDATWEVSEPGTIKVTVPNGNEMWGYRADAPRLLHKVTGDFDLEADMMLECAGLNLAISEFLAFVPGSSIGYLDGQFNSDGLKAQYLVLGGGWYRWQDLNRLHWANRPYETGPDPGEAPVRLRLSRRGDVFKTYWSLDGGITWELSGRRETALPETMWVGWVFKRMANDGLNDEPAVTTLSRVLLTTAPLGSMLDPAWDVVTGGGQVLGGGAQLQMWRDGTISGYTQVYSPWSLEGDFDVTVRYEASLLELQPEEERFIHVAVTSNDGKNHAYIRSVQYFDRHYYNVDMSINEAWYRYQEADTAQDSGRLRLARQDGIFSAYYEAGGEWIRLDQWSDTFDDPVYLDLRYEWKSPEPVETGVRFTIESLVTPEGVWFGPAAEDR